MYQQKVSVCCCKYPPAVLCHFKMQDRVRKTRQNRVSIFCAFLVQSDLPITAPDCETASSSCGQYVEALRRFVLPYVRYFAS